MLNEEQLMKKYPRYSKILLISFKMLATLFIILLFFAIKNKDWIGISIAVIEIFVCIVTIRDIQRSLKK